MNCSEFQELLSAYYDGELADDQRYRLLDHIDACADCAQELADFEKLSNMAITLDTPPPPEHLWNRLEQQLDQRPSDEKSTIKSKPVDQIPRWSIPAPKLLAIAATVLIAMGICWVAYEGWFAHGKHDHFTVEFGRYLDEFHRDPIAAQQFLLAKYESLMVDPEQAIRQVGYRPAVVDGLPDAYSVDSTYVMKMPCCTCTQCLCKRADGSTIVIFEHDDEETDEWFGDRPAVSAVCKGLPCRLTEFGDHIAVSWQYENRYITVIGVRDLAEVDQLVAWFQKRKQT